MTRNREIRTAAIMMDAIAATFRQAGWTTEYEEDKITGETHLRAEYPSNEEEPIAVNISAEPATIAGEWWLMNPDSDVEARE